MPPPVLMNFVVFPPGCGDSVADFWGCGAHEARLRCPSDVSGDTYVKMRYQDGPLSVSLLTTQTMVTMGIFPYQEKIPLLSRESNLGPIVQSRVLRSS